MYKHRANSETLAAAWDDAVEAGTDALEDEAVRRAKKSSDTLLIFLLKGRRPHKFKDRAVVEHDLTERLADRLAAARKRRSVSPIVS
jgi:hypothetical protein